MAQIITNDKHYTDIANAIRANSADTTASYKPEAMAQGIVAACQYQYQQGLANSGDSYNDGRQYEYDLFWDSFQKSGSRTNYWYGFSGYGWTQENLNPKYKITFNEASNTTQNATGMFYRCCQNTGREEDRIDFSVIADKFDFSGLKSARNLFDSCNMINIYADLSNCEVCTNTFARSWGGYLNYIAVKVSEKMTNCSNMFLYGNSITNLTFTEDSTIACNGLDVSACTELTHDSLISIINALQDKTSISGTWAVTLGSTNLAKLTDAEKAIATQKGWTLA